MRYKEIFLRRRVSLAFLSALSFRDYHSFSRISRFSLQTKEKKTGFSVFFRFFFFFNVKCSSLLIVCEGGGERLKAS